MSERERIAEIQFPDGTIYDIQDPDIGNIEVMLNEILGNTEAISTLVSDINGEVINNE